MPFIVAGSASRKLATRVAKLLQDKAAPYVQELELQDLKVARFSDGEIGVELEQSVRGDDVFIVQSTNPPANDNFMELCLTISACRRNGASSITVVCPYLAYARQDRLLHQKRTTISAADVATLIAAMGPTRFMTVELHAGQIGGFFRSIPVDDLSSTNTFVAHLPRLLNCKAAGGLAAVGKVVIVSPDAGGVDRCKRFLNKLRKQYPGITDQTSLAVIIKQRVKANEIASMDLVGSVEGATAVMIDDLTDTCGTLIKAAALLRRNGATKVIACVSHAVLSGPAAKRLRNDTALSSLCVLDTIDHSESTDEDMQELWRSGKCQLVSAAPMIASAVAAVTQRRSLSAALDKTSAALSSSAAAAAAAQQARL